MIHKPAVTIYDVADQAAVSISTVSRYLNNPDKVNAETGIRIKAAIDALAYIRHGNAGTKQSRQTGRIGILVPFFPAPSFVERMQGITPVLHNANCEMLIYSIDSPQQLDNYLRNGAFTKRLDGIIVMAMSLSEHDARLVHRSGMQVVMVEQHNPLFCSIECDNVRGGALAAEYLLSKNYAPYAYIGQKTALPYSLQPSDLRIKGFQDALKAAGQPLRPEFTLLGDVSVDGGFQLAMELLQR
ncbi:MAG: LacI family transcriptional regulator, partial [Spirochaetes bacterium]|nr:LacI family transcriptional regulator [Spirochaetota bacterium]